MRSAESRTSRSRGGSEITGREQAVYERWQEYKEPRNAYERTAFESFPREIDAEMDRVEQAAQDDEAARAAEDAEQEAQDWEAWCRYDTEQRDQEAGQ